MKIKVGDLVWFVENTTDYDSFYKRINQGWRLGGNSIKKRANVAIVKATALSSELYITLLKKE